MPSSVHASYSFPTVFSPSTYARLGVSKTYFTATAAASAPPTTAAFRVVAHAGTLGAGVAGALADALPSSPIAAFARDDDVGDSFNSSTVSARATTRVDARWCRRG